jgi:hypothetical protein
MTDETIPGAEDLPDDVKNGEIPDPAPAETVTVSGDNLTVTETPDSGDTATVDHGEED